MASHGVPRVTSAEDKSEQQKEKEQQKIQRYRELADLINAKITEGQYTLEVLALTSKLLTQNPEYYTVWNYRRRIFRHLFRSLPLPATQASSEELSPPQQTIHNHIVNDLRFLVPLLVKFPKCYWMWNHRLWLLQQATAYLPVSTARRLWQEELGLVGKMLGRDSRNFHGWNYRRMIVARLESLVLSDSSSGVDVETAGKSLAEEEYAYTTKMIRTNLSNFSAWHNRSKLIPRLLDERGADDDARRSMLDSEFELLHEALFTDPYDQSLWFYHQFLISTLTPQQPRAASIVTNMTEDARFQLFSRELTMLQVLEEDADDCKWIYRALLLYTASFREIDDNAQLFAPSLMREWLAKLRRLDPLRDGRWNDLEKTLNL